MGSSWLEILHDPLTRKLLGFDAEHAEKTPFISGVSSRLNFFLQDPMRHLALLKIGYTALEAFLQANCTGPPLDFNPEESIFPDTYRNDDLPKLKEEILQSLTVDGAAVYSLTPHLELFWLGKTVMSNSILADAGFNGRRARVRVNFWHQKLLTEKSDTMKSIIYADTDILEQQLGSRLAFGGAAAEEHFVEFLVERAQIRIHYGDDEKAREDLVKAAKTRHFQFALTGALGKRTKFQISDISQLVVLAKSRDYEPEPYSSRKSSRVDGMESRKGSQAESLPGSPVPRGDSMSGFTLSHPPGSVSHRPLTPTAAKSHEQDHTWPHIKTGPLSPRLHDHEHHVVSPLAATPIKPENLKLNDDTLLERIQFKQMPPYEPELTKISEIESLPARIANLEPQDQPLLFPVDSIILLATAQSISNTSPANGLTREETIPYATRVLDGGSSNWQVYTQALLVRSRIEGYRSRTAERGLLQLQALVDQIIAETDTSASPASKSDAQSSEEFSGQSTFLPKPKPSESASVAERLKYIYQLSPPLRWEMEAELAARWTTMGGLKTALEIYERLQMKAEIALCLAATDREAEAVKLLKRLLFTDETSTAAGEGARSRSTGGTASSSTPPTVLKLRSPPPPDSPRLLCILGDITSTLSYYSLAWTVSSFRYGRAQRSLARQYVKNRDFTAASEAYKLALDRAPLDRSTWFALGCIQLELEDWPTAVESFTRCVQLDDKDAESWSNLAVALLRLPAPEEISLLRHTEDELESSGLVPLQDIAEDSAEDSEAVSSEAIEDGDDEDLNEVAPGPKPDLYRHEYEALRALRRAATLKRDDARIWDNYLTVAASIPPSAGTPWAEIIQAMSRVIELRGKKEGEDAVDLKILEVLVSFVTESYESPNGEDDTEKASEIAEVKRVASREEEERQDQLGPTESNVRADVKEEGTVAAPRKRLPHLPRALLSLVDNLITPLATSSSGLYLLLSRVSLWRHRPAESLAYTEKAWRATTSVPGVYESEKSWEGVVDATARLVEAYKLLGGMERERTGGLVEVGWKFKSRNAVRGVLGRGKESWEGTPGWMRLEELGVSWNGK